MEEMFKKSYQMFEAAKMVIPGGIPFPRTPHFMSFGSQPVFIERAQGPYLFDVDGNKFIDYMCAFGAVALGYNHPKIDAAAEKQRKLANCTSLPGMKWLELAEFLVREIPSADWCVYGKNGSDVTTHAALVARTHTGRPGIARAHHAYHGLHHWCIESDVGIPPEYKAHSYFFNYNDVEDLEDCLTKNKDQIAAVMLTPVGHWALRDQEEPAPGFFEKARELCDKFGALLVFDDIRAGFRIKYEGAHLYYADIEPDIISFGKTIGNGYPLSVNVGKAHLMEAAKKVYFSGTHFYSGAPMAAAIACLEEMKAAGSIDRMRTLGERFMKGFRDAAKASGVKVSVTGHPAMPYMVIDEDPSREKIRFFCGEAAKRGVFLHPHHNWFISAALSDEDMEKTIETADACFKLVAKKYQ